MNISKNLKLGFLATSILFFPKAGHTMMTPEDEKPSAGSSKQAAGLEQERLVFNSLLPVGPSNQVPTASTDYRSGSNRMKKLFGQAFIPNEEINQRLDSLRSTSPENFQGVIGAIRTQLVENFTTSNTYSSRSSAIINSIFQSSLQDVISFALTLPKEEIELRSKEMIRTIVDLNNALPDSIAHSLLPSFALSPRSQTEEEVDRFYNMQLSEQVRRTPDLIYFFKDLLKFDPCQITQRTEAIKKNAHFLLPTSPKAWEEGVFPIMEFLLKLKTQDIVNRAQSMIKLLSFFKDAQYTYNNSIKRAAIPLDNPTLEERANSYTATLEALPGLEPIAIQLSYLSVKLEPTVFTSYVNFIKNHHLVQTLSVADFSALDNLVSRLNLKGIESAPSSGSSVPTSSSSSMPSVQPANPADEFALQASATKFQMGEPNSYPTTGFSAFEGSHRWTVGNKASITLPLAEMKPRPSSISFLNTKGLITPTHSQTLTVKVNRKLGNRYVYAPGNNNHTLEIPLPKDGPVIIQFEISNAASPSTLGINADKRELGISFGEVQFQY